MKNLLLLLLFACTLTAGAQNISGFYSGTLYNDSTKMTQKYELALSEYRGKISGYSYVTFVSNDTFYYGIRKIKAEIVGDSLIVRDDKMLVNNFPEAPAKGVGRVITIPLKGQDSLVILTGRWKTNQTKKYYSVPGAIALNRSTDSTNSPLISHLKELNIVPSVSYQNTDLMAVSEPVTKPKAPKVPEEVKPEKAAVTTASVKPSRKEKEAKKREESSATSSDVNTSQPVARNEKPDLKPNQLPQTDKETEMKANTEVVAAIDKPSKKETKTRDREEKSVEEKVAPHVPSAPVTIPFAERKSRHIQTLEVNSDSLVLAFYDNGVVDGDSISVFLNGREVISHARLRTVATKLPISISGTEELTLLLVAENLGSLPPNTGLITIRDGDEVHQVNFNADLQTNNTIIIRKKR
jgi:hypothetical protein